MHERLKAVFQRAFWVDNISDETSIDTLLEWDSLRHIGLILEIEAEFGIPITPVDAIEMISVRAIREILAEKEII